jgi:hypothetical protein
MKGKKDVNFIRNGSSEPFMDTIFVDIYDVFIYDGKEHMIIGYGMCDAADELLTLRNDGEGRPYVGIKIADLRDKVAEYKASDKFLAYILHKHWGTREIAMFDIATGRSPYPKQFERNWTSHINKNSKFNNSLTQR